MTNRRNFIKHSLLASGALSFGINEANANPLSVSLNNLNEIEDEQLWKLIRSQFPLLSTKTFLNNGTSGPSPFSVIHAIQNEMMDIEKNGRYGGNEDIAINSLARFLGTKQSEISLTRNVTEGINIICWGLNLKAGDEVIMTKHEHVGHAGPWLNRAKLHGIVSKPMELGKTAEETIDLFKKKLTKKTKVISIPHIPCTIGQVLPVKEICAIAKSMGIITMIDGAHPPGMLSIDLKDINCDFYVGCCHKWMLGPKGTGFLYVSENARPLVQVYYGGGGVDTGWDMLSNPPKMESYVDNGHRFFYGTQNAALFKGIEAAVLFHEQIGKKRIENRVKQLANYLQEQLLNLSTDIEMLTPTESISKGAQIAFKIKGKEMSELQKKGYENNIITRYVPENNINCLRVSTHIYNNETELDSLLKVIDQFIKNDK